MEALEKVACHGERLGAIPVITMMLDALVPRSSSVKHRLNLVVNETITACKHVI